MCRCFSFCSLFIIIYLHTALIISLSIRSASELIMSSFLGPIIDPGSWNKWIDSTIWWFQYMLLQVISYIYKLFHTILVFHGSWLLCRFVTILNLSALVYHCHLSFVSYKWWHKFTSNFMSFVFYLLLARCLSS